MHGHEIDSQSPIGGSYDRRRVRRFPGHQAPRRTDLTSRAIERLLSAHNRNGTRRVYPRPRGRAAASLIRLATTTFWPSDSIQPGGASRRPRWQQTPRLEAEVTIGPVRCRSWTSTSSVVGGADCCTRPTAQKSTGARTATPSRWATAAGAPSGEAVANVAATWCLLRLSAAALSKRSSRHDLPTGLGGADVLCQPPSARGSGCRLAVNASRSALRAANFGDGGAEHPLGGSEVGAGPRRCGDRDRAVLL